MDILLGISKPSKVLVKDEQTAPIELMSEFLVLISEQRLEAAFELTKAILQYEPNNSMIKDYQQTIQLYMSQGFCSYFSFNYI